MGQFNVLGSLHIIITVLLKIEYFNCGFDLKHFFISNEQKVKNFSPFPYAKENTLIYGVI